MTPRIQVLPSGQGDFSYTAAGDTTDIALQVSTVSAEEINLWDKQKIVDSIIREAQAAPDLALEIADEVEKTLVATGQTRVTTSLIRELVDLQLMERGLSHMLERHTKLGLPMFDVENIITQPNKENSNTTHNPESINLTIAETVLKQYALQRVFSEDIARAHYEGDIHLHDLGFCVRPYTYIGDTLVRTSDGRLVSLKDLYEEYPFEKNPESGTFVKYPGDGLRIQDKGGCVEVRRLVKREKGSKRMFFVKLADGRSCVVTHDHPMLVRKEDGYEARPAEKLEEGDHLSTYEERSPTRRRDHLDLLSSFRDAGVLSKYNVIFDDGSKMAATSTMNHLSSGKIAVADLRDARITSCSPSNASLPVELPLTRELGWLVGMIIGDGHLGNKGGQIEITSGDNEYFDKLIQVLDCLGFPVKVIDRGTCVRARIQSSILMDVFWEVMRIGHTSREKKLPWFFAEANDDFLSGLVAGVIDSDGTVEHSGISIRVSSSQLTLQLYEALTILGLKPMCRKPEGAGTEREFRGKIIRQRYPLFAIYFTRTTDNSIPSIKYRRASKANRTLRKDSSESVTVLQVREVEIPDRYIYDVTTESGTFLANGIYSKNCGGHSLEYVKKYGLKLPNITSTSSPARHPDVLIGHMVKMASTLQSYYAGAIGWEAVNVFFAPFLVGLPYERIRQLAEMLIFEFNQLAGARGSLRRDERIFVYDKLENQVKLVEIGKFADSFIQREGEATAPVEDDRYYAFSFDHDTGQTCLSRIYAAIRHENNHRIVNLKTSQGQNVKVTDNHSLFKFDEDGRIVKAQPKENPDVVLVPNSIGINLGREEIDVLALLDRREVALEDGRVFVVEKAKSRLGVDRFLNITPELTRLIGYYVAEGSLGSQVQLAIFHEQTARDVEDCVRAVFGVPCHHRDGSCFFGGKTHVALFEALCGKRAENKRIPAEILLGDGEGAVEFLSAYLSGDGWVAGNRIGCSTVSDTLASHVWLMFSRLGCMPSMRKEEIETGLEIKGVAVAETKTRHVITIGKMAMDKVKFVHREKEGKRLAAIRKSGKRYDQKGYSYHHIREQVKTVFGDRISVKALNKVSPQMIEELHAEVSRRLSTVDIELLKNLHDEDFVGICKEYVLGNKELCYSTSYGLLRQLERGEVPVHSTHIRTDEVLKGTCYEQVEMKGVIDALSIPRAIDSGSGINRSHSFFDSRQLDSNLNMLKHGLRLALHQNQEMAALRDSLERATNLLPATVTRIEPIENDEFVYDIGVEKTENFLTAEGIFAHNSQVVFTDFNLYWNVPRHLRDAPAIGPGGEPTGKPYSEYEKEAQLFLKALFEIYMKGDAVGKTFVFPKPLLHINDDFFKTDGWEEFLDLACEVASKQGITYFVYDRGDEITVSQCCRLKLKLEEVDLQEALTPEKMRFSALQNITLNLPRIAYRAHGSEELLLSELEKTLEMVARAHLQKKKFIYSLMELGRDGPVSLLTMEHDGETYLRLDRLTYLVGLLGLNEMVQHHRGEQLHQSSEALRFGLKVVAHMSLVCERLSEKYGINMVLEESPAESSGYRLAKLDMKYFPNQAREVVKGDAGTGNYYYTNSIHIATDAAIDYIDRVKKQSLFHPLIKAGAIIHIWLGEHEPPPATIRKFVEKTFKETNASQIAFSPEFTVCNTCNKTSRGLSEECPRCGSTDTYGVTRIVGYFSKVSTWNKGKLGELVERRRTSLIGGKQDGTEGVREGRLSQLPCGEGGGKTVPVQ
ncbi:MAG: hypothetical protein KKF66_01820 [Actinobacteria bacterium]|nr:hypothetical protein [Actinomycetota bacterium]